MKINYKLFDPDGGVNLAKKKARLVLYPLHTSFYMNTEVCNGSSTIKFLLRELQFLFTGVLQDVLVWQPTHPELKILYLP